MTDRMNSFRSTEIVDQILGVPRKWFFVCGLAILFSNFLINSFWGSEFGIFIAGAIGGLVWLAGIILARRDPDFMDQFNRYHRTVKNPDGEKDNYRNF